MNLKDACTGLLVGQRELDLTIQSPRTKQSGVKDIDTVGSSNDLNGQYLPGNAFY